MPNRALARGLEAIDDGFERAKRLISGRRDNPIQIVPYRGYGTRERLWLRGRVIEREAPSARERRGTMRTLRAMLRRYESDEIPGARVEAMLGERRFELTSDDEGHFELTIEHPPRVQSPWTELSLRLCAPLVEGQDNPPVRGLVRVPAPSARRGIVSDVDDTVVKTGATKLVRHVRTVLLNGAHERKPFDGVAELYRALEKGAGGEGNPFFYVSSSPWNVYDVLEAFLELHDLPLGPILLKDFGVDREKIFKEGHVDYKAARIADIFDTYPELPFLLIGDSGQKDAWVFERLAMRYPDRVLAVYLREVNGAHPDPEIERIQARLREAGVTMVRFSDSESAAQHAREQGWIG